MDSEIIWSVIYVIIGIALHFFKKYRDQLYQKKKTEYDQFLEGDYNKMEYNIRKFDLEMVQSYNKWLPLFMWFFWIGSIVIVYRAFFK